MSIFSGRRSFLLATAAGAGSLVLGKSALMQAGVVTAKRTAVRRGETFPKLPIGMNLAGIADWEPGFPFRNLFLGARPWLTRNADGTGPHNTATQEKFTFDEHGYPQQVPVVAKDLAQPQTVFTYLPLRPPASEYILLHDGEGEFGTFGSTKILSAQQGRVKLHIGHTATSVAIEIKNSKAGDHIRNIRFIPLTDEMVDLASDPFLPEFLRFCRRFHCIRFMDWASVNTSLEEEWSDRKLPDFYTMVAVSGDPEAQWGPPPTGFQRMFAGGVAIETMIQLANKLQIDPWFCIPHRATDQYIAEFAKLVHRTLDPRLRVYLEYSNELWNWGFVQAGWMLRSRLAGDLVEANGGTAWSDADKTKGVNHPARIGALFRRTFAIWEREWDGADRDRLVRVCAVQGAWADASIDTAKWCLAYGGADAISPAAYIGATEANYSSWKTLGRALTPERVLSDVRENLEITRRDSAQNEIIAFGRANGLRYVAYEGGQHLQPRGQKDEPYNSALKAAQYHPGMFDVYIELLRLQRDLGCELFAHFSSVGAQGSRYGSWGAKSRYDEPDEESPKMRALLAANTSKAPSV